MKQEREKMPELLSPVGGMLQLKAAINNGADAVYMGGSLFNARMKAQNFNNQELKEAIDYAHENCVKVYITLNTLIKDSELAKAFEYVNHLYGIGADAVIMQDLGLLRLVRRYLPDMPVHWSTQGTIYNRGGLEFMKRLGVTRIVPARELSLEEIRALKSDRQGSDGNDMEVEVFVHGALCMCYSGQCQMSRLLDGKGSDGSMGGARSGNRGLCAQPCRLSYMDDYNRKTYALSPKDMCALSLIPQLCQAGVDSFKIEGRLKSPEYVAAVTGIYRKYIDFYESIKNSSIEGEAFDVDSWERMIDPHDMHKLSQVFNRGGFGTGYLQGNPGKDLLSGKSPKNQGTYVGRVTKVMDARGKGGNQGRKLIEINNDGLLPDGAVNGISRGDGIELVPASGIIKEKLVGNIVTFMERKSKNRLLLGDFKGEISVGDQVYKVTDKALNDSLTKSLSDAASHKKLPIKMSFTARVGQLPVLKGTIDKRKEPLGHIAFDLDSGGMNTEEISVVAKGAEPAALAINKAMDAERVRVQLSKLGSTNFAVRNRDTDIEINIDDNIALSIATLNAMRRDMAEGLRNRLIEQASIGRKPLRSKEMDDILNREMKDCEMVTTEELRDTLLVPIEEFMLDKYSDESRSLLPYVLHVSKGNLDRYIEKNFDHICDKVADSGILLGNLAWIEAFQQRGIKVYGDFGLNVYNEQARKLLEDLGVNVIVMSDELSRDGRHVNRVKGLSRKPELLNNVPLMITEHPIEGKYLTDRKGVSHKVYRWHSGDKYLLF